MSTVQRQPMGGYGMTRPEPESLADLLERVLDKGVVIAGDIRVDLLEIELLTIRIRLLLVSVDKAAEMGIDWWTRDPMLSGSADAEELERLRRRVDELEAERGNDSADKPDDNPADNRDDDNRDDRHG
ncbi:gas vesicle protein [Kribbella sp.]|uniref:gas vesicle protein n=1 Tax=Kribbella sp. TaxID=1871183 RepID=UPI002D575EDC|nr:gas vesicle protein [Kribbella sp.]HZX05777.1 gas vesicle protein [Kribbella sp.]